MAAKKGKKKTKKQLSRKQKLLRAAAIVLLCALMGVLSSDMVGGRWQNLRRKTIAVNGRTVAVNPSLAVNELNQEAFAKTTAGRAVYTGGNCLHGIDVSVFQGDIDWKKVAQDGVDFVFIRAGCRGYMNGAMVQDECFAANLKGAQENGLKVGVYFFSQAVNEAEAVEEADFVISMLKKTSLDLPIVFDWEAVEQEFDPADESHAPVRTAGMRGSVVTDCALAFSQRVKEKGFDSMIFVNNDTGYFLYDISRLQGEKLWYASYRSHWANFYYRINAWQYSEQGSVDGIDAPVDLDLWFELEEPEVQ